MRRRCECCRGATFEESKIMNRLCVASACALFLVACSKVEPTAPPNPVPGVAADASKIHEAVLILDKTPT